MLTKELEMLQLDAFLQA